MLTNIVSGIIINLITKERRLLMTYKELEEILDLKYPILSITRLSEKISSEKLNSICALTGFKEASQGKDVYLSIDNSPCYGVITGGGFVDGIPNTPGGYGYFLSYGRGEGYPKGEKVKKTPDIAEKMILGHPQNVMDGYQSIRVKKFETDDINDTIAFIVNPDQLSGLVHLFNYNRSGYDTIISPMCSGCASIFRIPFGEVGKECSKAVIGNFDIGSRIHFDADLLFFIVTQKDFDQMLIDAEECIFNTKAWKLIKKRLHNNV